MAKIKVTKNGPYLVSGNLPLEKENPVIGSEDEPERWEKQGSFPAAENYSLCRCGKSKNKPFCDGAHVKAGFDGTETAKHKNFSELSEITSGPALDLADAECFCSIARFCHRAGDTWTHTEKSDDPTLKKMAIEEAGNCPSGRLVAMEKETNKPIEPDFKPSISITEDTKNKVNGPIWVKGGVQVEAADGYQYEVRNRTTLCRCGGSHNKPFCDGKHIRAKFSGK